MNKTAAFLSSIMEQLNSVPFDENHGLEMPAPFSIILKPFFMTVLKQVIFY